MNPIYMWYVAQCVGVLGTLAAIGGGGVAAWKAIAEWKRATLQRADELKQRELELDQRKQEFRQKQAIFAREVIRDIFADKRAFDALTMLDFSWNEYQTADKSTTYRVDRGELQPVLRGGTLENDDNDDKGTFIRRCFEGLYDHLEQVENLVEIGVLNIEDLETTFRYYMQRALQDDIRHEEFWIDYDYPKTKRFAERFGTTALPSSETASAPTKS